LGVACCCVGGRYTCGMNAFFCQLSVNVICA